MTVPRRPRWEPLLIGVISAVFAMAAAALVASQLRPSPNEVRHIVHNRLATSLPPALVAQVERRMADTGLDRAIRNDLVRGRRPVLVRYLAVLGVITLTGAAGTSFVLGRIETRPNARS